MSSLLAWGLVLAAGALEVAMAFALKASDGGTRPLPSVLALVTALGSIWLLATAVRALPLGVAYAVWTGIGAVGVTLVGMLAFAEAPSVARLVFMALVFVGIVGLKVSQ
ncbi:DMT family transporter [Pseudoduganella armeniaca]|uniref:Guanidinium exporter n=1 Tax=Pseudoduganella armeniaca TaxID=2072590 RepID=A0A2R4C4W4_9BURK|nr:multidrug efflux SMR transporter [Pseudoduganella armeniaca]AVR94639.1 QacE family quaternary ammonium compound efflux SMR transporter [Pseudoduganella armeniaca]